MLGHQHKRGGRTDIRQWNMFQSIRSGKAKSGWPALFFSYNLQRPLWRLPRWQYSRSMTPSMESGGSGGGGLLSRGDRRILTTGGANTCTMCIALQNFCCRLCELIRNPVADAVAKTHRRCRYLVFDCLCATDRMVGFGNKFSSTARWLRPGMEPESHPVSPPSEISILWP